MSFPEGSVQHTVGQGDPQPRLRGLRATPRGHFERQLGSFL